MARTPLHRVNQQFRIQGGNQAETDEEFSRNQGPAPSSRLCFRSNRGASLGKNVFSIMGTFQSRFSEKSKTRDLLDSLSSAA